MIAGSDTIKRFVILTTVSFSSFILYSQNIAGRWQGKSYWPGIEGDSTKVYLELNWDSANIISGFSVSISAEFYGKALINGNYDVKSDTYFLYEDEMIDSHVRPKRNFILDKYILTFNRESPSVLYGKIECTAYKKIDRTSWYCSEERTIIFYRTNKSIPDLIKRKSDRIRVIQAKD